MSRKINILDITTDDAADDYYKALEDRLTALKRESVILDAEIIGRKTDDGDLRQLVELYTQRVEDQKAELNKSTELMISDSKSPTTVTGAESNALAVEFGTWFLKLHAGLEDEARASKDLFENMRKGGTLLMELLTGLTEQYSTKPGDFIAVEGHLVPKAWADVQAYRDRLQGAFDSVSRKMLGKVTGDPVHLAQQIADAIDKLRALPASTTPDESTYIDVLGKAASMTHTSGEDFTKFAKRVVDQAASTTDDSKFFAAVEKATKVKSNAGEDFAVYLNRSVREMTTVINTDHLDRFGKLVQFPRNADESNKDYAPRLREELERLAKTTKSYWDELGYITKLAKDNGVVYKYDDTCAAVTKKLYDHAVSQTGGTGIDPTTERWFIDWAKRNNVTAKPGDPLISIVTTILNENAKTGLEKRHATHKMVL